MTIAPSPGRKASRSVAVAAALATLSVSVVACADSAPAVTADCVVKQPNGQYKAVDDDYCDDRRGGGSSFIWIYGGTSRGGYVSGGTTYRPANTNITSRSGKVVVGGFGGSAKSGGGS
ncbi:hypothetical protein AB0G05_27435 [Nonomuraea wenchangensis]